MSSVGVVSTPTTIDDSLSLQEDSNVLVAPIIPGSTSTPPPTTSTTSSTNGALTAAAADATPTTLNIALVNQTTSSNAYAYITGLATESDSALWLLQSDGQTSYFPTGPAAIGSALAVNCAIPLGAPGASTTVTVPYLAGARIWFSVDSTITFLLNPTTTGAAALVQPSVTNPSDPNINIKWDFCEFTFNDFEVYINISYVDFVSLPISLTLLDTSGNTTHVSGMASDGLDTICEGLIAQTNTDGYQWNELIVTGPDGSYVRALSPNSGIQLDSSRFSGYYDQYVDAVWSQYTSEPLSIDTQAQWGTVTATVASNLLTFSGVGTFAQPTSADIFNCSSGPFAAAATNADEMGAITARLTAALNRATLLIDTVQPDDENPTTYYTNSICNHYGRIVHAANLDGKGYTFPYDDVTPTGGVDQSGFLANGAPSLLTVTVGGGNAYTKVKPRNVPTVRQTSKSSMPLSKYSRREKTLRNLGHIKIPKRHQKRAIGAFDAEPEPRTESTEFKSDAKVKSLDMDLEKGLPFGEKQMGYWQEASMPRKEIPRILQQLLESRIMTTLRTYASDPRIKPFVNLANSVIAGVLSLTMRAFVSRIFVLLFVFFLYFFIDTKGDGAAAQAASLLQPASPGTSNISSIAGVNGTTAQSTL